MALGTRFRSFLLLVMVLCLSVVPVVNAQDSTPAGGFSTDENAACADSRLRVRDLKSIDDTIEPGVKRATEEAQQWQKDSRLYTLRLGCPLFVTGVKWEGVFFSESAQAFYETDTGLVDPVEVDPKLIPTLAPDKFRMSLVYDALITYGFTDDLLLTAAGGVTIKTNTPQMPFGPPTTEAGSVYAHIAVEQQDVVIDVWISMTDYSVHVYTPSS
ncbi:MAG: hypothetical protein M9953_08665 [Thermomicrobiales bacterium]|nr:hypothetical protein [Thermomicrobiales bacterium]MCO5228788.1 hypothetical protein [Thermomicrobiales bacterium]